jgi:hypothetical protein
VIGLHIATDIGPMFPPGDGPGLKTNPGASRLSTMAVGPSYEAAGAGFQGRLPSSPSMLPPWLHSSAAEDLASESASDQSQSDGSRLPRERFTFLGIAPVRAMFKM